MYFANSGRSIQCCGSVCWNSTWPATKIPISLPLGSGITFLGSGITWNNNKIIISEQYYININNNQSLPVVQKPKVLVVHFQSFVDLEIVTHCHCVVCTFFNQFCNIFDKLERFRVQLSS